MNKGKELSKLKKTILKFNKYFPNKNLVFADGNRNSQVMVIGEAPGKTEDKLRKPFVGRAGKLLDELLNSIHLDRTKVYITNVVNYRPNQNRKPSLNEILIFRPLLFNHIEIIMPKKILLLGLTAAQAVLDHEGPLQTVRGIWKKITINKYSYNILTTFHPAYLLRQPNVKKKAWKDLLKFQKLI
jgi:uracil-DNA glycosylase family 4